MIKQALHALQNKQIILYPTDTVWGIGGDATSVEVVEKIYQLKQRTDHKSLIALVKNIQMLTSYVDEIPETAIPYLKEIRPTTLIYTKGINLAPNLMGSDGSIGLRIPRHNFCQELLEAFGKPIISTSANISGSETPKNFSGIATKILEGVDYIVHLQQETKPNQPSRVIKIETNGEVNILRV